MSIAVHDPLQFYCGDTWEIVFDCHDGDGSPLDLTNVEIEWKLDTYEGVNVKTKTLADGALSILAPAADGRCALMLSAAESESIRPGFYRDQLRVTIPATTDTPTIVTTQSTGRIEAVESLA